MEDASIAITLLTAMITPAVLIAACGSLSLTTSQRLNRSIERTRKLSLDFEEIRESKKKVSREEQLMLFDQLQRAARRAVLLQRAMTLLYIAMGFFIATSLLIGFFEVLQLISAWLLIVLPMIGALALLSASIVLIAETRLALGSVDREMNYRLSSSATWYPKDPDNSPGISSH